jgi:hypothetical protein
MRAVARPALVLCLIEFLIDHFEFPRPVIPRALLGLRLARGLPRDPRVSFDKPNISRSLLIDYGRSELMLYIDVHDAVEGHIRYQVVVLGEILVSVRGLAARELAQRLRILVMPMQILMLRGLLIQEVVIVIEHLHIL